MFVEGFAKTNRNWQFVSFMMHVGKFQNLCRQNKEMFAVFRLFTFPIPVIQMLPKISNWASVGLNSREGG